MFAEKGSAQPRINLLQKSLLQFLFKDTFLRKKRKRNLESILQEIEREKSLTKSTINSFGGKFITKSDIASPKSESAQLRTFYGNIYFSVFPNHNVAVGTKRNTTKQTAKNSWRPGSKFGKE